MLELYFITSNPTKLAHFTYLGRLLGVKIIGFRQRTYYGSYSEPDSVYRDEVLSKSYESAADKWRRSGLPSNAMFFFDDTSVRIDALSGPDNEVPGTRIKYWMRENTFEDLNLLLGDSPRGASVRSDLVLHLPKDLRSYIAANQDYLTFAGKVDGVISERPSGKEDINALYPWLDPKSFSGWFVPAGASGPLSDLDIESANKHDFRLQSFRCLLDFLSSVHLYPSTEDLSPIQEELFNAPSRKVIVFLGPTCAGKTTAARFLSDNGRAIHLEASDFMRAEFVRRHGPQTGLHVRDFAMAALNEQPWIVPEQLTEIINQFPAVNFVVSGLRSLKEVDLLRSSAKGELICFWIGAGQGVRFKRSVMRGRPGAPSNLASFREEDKRQLAMGLLSLKRRMRKFSIKNEGSLDELRTGIEAVVDVAQKSTWPEREDAFEGILGVLERRLLLALGRVGGDSEYFTSGQLSSFTQNPSNGLPATEKDNISRFFTQASYPFFELKKKGSGTAVKLSNSGLSMFRQLDYIEKRAVVSTGLYVK